MSNKRLFDLLSIGPNSGVKSNEARVIINPNTGEESACLQSLSGARSALASTATAAAVAVR
jgi:hypothetical protein